MPACSHDSPKRQGKPLQVSEGNERAVYQSMIDGCAAALRGYPTSIDEDLALLRSGALPPGSRAELAVRVRGVPAPPHVQLPPHSPTLFSNTGAAGAVAWS